MNELPKVYPVPVNKKIKNNNEMFYSKDNSARSIIKDKNQELSIASKINRIFNAPDFVYKKKVTIITNQGTSIKNIIGKTRGYLLTDTNEAIAITEILDIQ